jgi:Peptidase C13 family
MFPPFQYTFTPSFDEALLAQQTAGISMLKSLRGRRMGMPTLLISITGFLLSMGAIVFALQVTRYDQRMMLYVLLALLVAALGRLYSWAVPGRRSHQALAQRMAAIEHNIEISDEGIAMHNTYGHARAAWSDIRFVQHDKGLLRLSRDLTPVFYLPARCVPADAWPALLQYVQQQHEGAKPSFSSPVNTLSSTYTPHITFTLRSLFALSSGILLTVCLFSSPWWEPRASTWLWHQLYGNSKADAQDDAPQANAAAEEWLYGAHQKTLDAALAAIPLADDNKPSLYALSIAGAAYQRVFEREVKAVSTLIQESGARYSGRLINSKTTLDDAPIATITSIADMITRIGERMNREQDVLLLYLTSHGSPASEGHEFQLEHGGAELAQLRPEDLRTVLDAARIKHRVIIISACYAGGWLKALEDDNTVVMTAARSDRTSFGCSDHNDWTWFGEALMKEQWPVMMREGEDLKAAFEAAKRTIAAREKTEGYEASEPQASFGAAGVAQFQRVMRANKSAR